MMHILLLSISANAVQLQHGQSGFPRLFVSDSTTLLHTLHCNSNCLNSLHCLVSLIGGKSYDLSKHVLTPVFKPANDKEIRFNEAHTKIHNVMRVTLGSMKRRFRCLMQLGFAQETALNKKANIIKACSVLHNIAKKFSVPPPPVAGKIEPLHPGKQHTVPVEVNPEALQARQKLIDDNFSSVRLRQNPQDNSSAESV